MRYLVVIDTNVLVSAMLKSGSNPYTVLEEALVGRITPVINDEIIEEYKDVLNRKKFKFEKDKIDAVIEDIRERSIVVTPNGIDSSKVSDHDDVVFYEVCMESRKTEDTFLVTGNLKHFPEEPFIVTPAEMLDILNSKK